MLCSWSVSRISSPSGPRSRLDSHLKRRAEGDARLRRSPRACRSGRACRGRSAPRAPGPAASGTASAGSSRTAWRRRPSGSTGTDSSRSDDSEPDEQTARRRPCRVPGSRRSGVAARCRSPRPRSRRLRFSSLTLFTWAETSCPSLAATESMPSRKMKPREPALRVGVCRCRGRPGEAVDVDLTQRLGSAQTRHEQRPREQAERDGDQEESNEQNEDHDVS